MPMDFTPKTAYLLGMWLHKPYLRGFGVVGRECVEVFTELLMDVADVEPNKLTVGEDYSYVFHHRIQNAFKRFSSAREHRFKYANDYSAAYFAGWYDCSADFKGKVFLRNADKMDEMILTRLNFMPTFRGKTIVLGKTIPFLRFIRDYLRVKNDEVSKILEDLRF